MIRTFNMDNREFMRAIPNKHYDLVIDDPPYFSGPEKRSFYGSRKSSIGVSRLYKPSENWQVPTDEYFAQLERISHYYIVFGCNYFKYHFHSGRIIWDKCNDSSDYSDAEIAATNLFDHVRIFRFMWNGMLQGESVLNGSKMQGNKKLNQKRIHPTEKPVALYKWLLHKYAKIGWKIADLHGGSMSHAIAAHDLDFDLDIVEQDIEHYRKATQRLANHQKQLKLI